MMKYIKVFVKWAVLAVLVGAIGGTVGSLFHLAVDAVTEVREGNAWLVWLLPVGGVLITGLYLLTRKYAPLDTNRVIRAVQGEGDVPTLMAPVIFVSTALSHLLGASVGREGAALQLGGSIGYRVGKLARLDDFDLRVIVMSGMAAVFSALFGTPLAAAFFAIEVAVVGVMHYSALLPCIISSYVAYEVAHFFRVPPVRFDAVFQPELSLLLIAQVTVLAALCAGVCLLFCFVIEACEVYARKWIPNMYVRAALGGGIIVLLTLFLGTHDYNGAGMNVIETALLGNANPEAFLLKIMFTSICIAAGFKGGEIVPTFFIGATFGCLVGGLLGLDPALGAAIGFACLFCGVVNCPTASIFLAVEVFGGGGVLMFAYACVLTYLLSGRRGLYHSQKRELFSTLLH